MQTIDDVHRYSKKSECSLKPRNQTAVLFVGTLRTLILMSWVCIGAAAMYVSGFRLQSTGKIRSGVMYRSTVDQHWMTVRLLKGQYDVSVQWFEIIQIQ